MSTVEALKGKIKTHLCEVKKEKKSKERSEEIEKERTERA